jgi:hypothetical protein
MVVARIEQKKSQVVSNVNVKGRQNFGTLQGSASQIGTWEAPSDFGLLVAQNSSSNKSIAIIGTLDVDIKLIKWLIL